MFGRFAACRPFRSIRNKKQQSASLKEQTVFDQQTIKVSQFKFFNNLLACKIQLVYLNDLIVSRTHLIDWNNYSYNAV